MSELDALETLRQYLDIPEKSLCEYALDVKAWDSREETLAAWLQSESRWSGFHVTAEEVAWLEPRRSKILSLILDLGKGEYIFAGAYRIDENRYASIVTHEIGEYAAYKGMLRIRTNTRARRYKPFLPETFEESITGCVIETSGHAEDDVALRWPIPPSGKPGRNETDRIAILIGYGLEHAVHPDLADAIAHLRKELEPAIPPVRVLGVPEIGDMHYAIYVDGEPIKRSEAICKVHPYTGRKMLYRGTVNGIIADLRKALTGRAPVRYEPRIKDNGDGTVTDRQTGLTWLSWCFESLEYRKAVNKVVFFSADGDADWRLPTKEEIFAIAPLWETTPLTPYEFSRSGWDSLICDAAPVFWVSDTRRVFSWPLFTRAVCAVDIRTGKARFHLPDEDVQFRTWPVRG